MTTESPQDLEPNEPDEDRHLLWIVVICFLVAIASLTLASFLVGCTAFLEPVPSTMTPLIPDTTTTVPDG